MITNINNFGNMYKKILKKCINMLIISYKLWAKIQNLGLILRKFLFFWIDNFTLDIAEKCDIVVEPSSFTNHGDKMTVKIHHLGKALFSNHGTFEVTITPRGGIELAHDKAFRNWRFIGGGKVERENARKFRVKFSDLLLAYLVPDFKECTLFYIDEEGKVLGRDVFSDWILVRGEDGVRRERRALAIIESDEYKSKIRFCFPPLRGRGVPPGTTQIAFRFEQVNEASRMIKYSMVCEVQKDLRIAPRPAMKTQPGYRARSAVL